MKTKNNLSDIKNIICMVIISLLLLILMHDLCGSSILGQSNWNSYELQAQAWLRGEVCLDKNYSHLELAIFEDNYYVSFPPFPSVVMLPFVLIFGSDVPNNLIMALVCIITVLLVYKILRKCKTSELASAFFAMFFVFGSNMLAMSLNGGVWFVAQAFNMLLCVMAVDFALAEKRSLAYICLGLAVGCRPFSAIYIVALFIYWFIKDGKLVFADFAKRQILPALPLIFIAAAYMAYNYVRFRNPLEFGHNYLPEFANEPQFALKYLVPNLRQLLFEPIHLDSKLNISFPKFNGFWFYITNPVFILAAYKSVVKIIKAKRISITRLLFAAALVLNLIFICCHKTLGGWQFGARYTCDLMAFALFILLADVKEDTDEKNIPLLSGETCKALTLNRFDIIIMAFGLMFNAIGAAEFWLNLI